MKFIGTLVLAMMTMCLHGQKIGEGIHLNQVGYYPTAEKIAIVTDPSATSYVIKNGLGDVVKKGDVVEAGEWYADGSPVKMIDFSDIERVDSYRITTNSGHTSYQFDISNTALLRPSRGALRYFYLNRSSTSITEKHGGRYERPIGHRDDNVTVHYTAASEGLPKETKISSPGGWYDAGDYGKYMSTAGISTYSLLLTYEHYTNYLKGVNLNIPESENTMPDILDECLWELRWMFTMQDPTDGGIFHKLTTKNFSGMELPHKVDKMERFVCGRNTVVTLDFAATMAVAHRVFKNYEKEVPGFADSCLVVAKKAMDWAIANPDVEATQCEEFVTGAYGDSGIKDEWTWAPVEMFIATGDESYLSLAKYDDEPVDEANWVNKMVLPYLSILTHPKSFAKQKSWVKRAESKVKNLSNSYVSYKEKSNPYHVAMGEDESDWVWGSNGVAMNQSMVLFTAYKIFNKQEYLDAAMSNVNYLLGLNPTGYSYMSGFGDKKLYNMHHRISVGDDIREPVPGLVSGGPWLTNQNECPNYPETNAPGKKFVDAVCSYSTNEMTINWNAPTAYSLIAAQAVYSK